MPIDINHITFGLITELLGLVCAIRIEPEVASD
jgi:hypothetical protein